MHDGKKYGDIQSDDVLVWETFQNFSKSTRKKILTWKETESVGKNEVRPPLRNIDHPRRRPEAHLK